jgi:penicillin-binding protein 2
MHGTYQVSLSDISGYPLARDMKNPILFLFIVFMIASCTFGGRSSPTQGPSPTLPDPQVTTISAPDAERAVKTFLELWNDRAFDKMYETLSPLTTDSISKTEFLERYEDVGTALALLGIEYEIVSSLINPQSAQVRYRLTLNSAVLGDIKRETWIDLTRVENEWKVAWTSESILPELSQDKKLLLAPLVPIRANIYDRNGLALATQGKVAAFWLVPNQIGDEDAEEAMLRTLSRLLDRTQESILSLYDDIRQYDWYVHLGEVSYEEYQPFEDTILAMEGVFPRTFDSRYYFAGGLAPHAVGYVSLISAEELEEYQRLGYLGDEFVGKTGLEWVYEDALRGRPGGTLYLTDSEGQLEKAIINVSPEAPAAVYSTIDRDLQRQVQKAIEGLEGAIVVLERDTGAVLAMVSSPGFDPNLFNPAHPYSGGGLEELFSDPDRPLFNRATRGLYPLGSTFKIITTAAALESAFFEPGTIYNCGLEFRELPGVVLYDWRYERELPAQGEISLTQGLVRSCNPWFYHIGLDLYNNGLTTALPDMARGFGLGESTGIEIGDEAGLVPDPEMKQAEFGEEWGPQDAVSLAIGQSFLQATPLQLARYIAAVGNGGTLYRPQLVERIQSPEGEIRHEFEPEAQGQLPISEETLTAIQDALLLVIRHERGTARIQFLGLNLDIAGKTGTATTGEYSEPHAWFAGYSFEGREDKPDIAVVVLVEYAGEGSEWAAPIFRRVMESYFFGQPYKLYPWEERIGVWKTETPTPTMGPGEGEEDGTPTPEP